MGSFLPPQTHKDIDMGKDFCAFRFTSEELGLTEQTAAAMLSIFSLVKANFATQLVLLQGSICPEDSNLQEIRQQQQNQDCDCTYAALYFLTSDQADGLAAFLTQESGSSETKKLLEAVGYVELREYSSSQFIIASHIHEAVVAPLGSQQQHYVHSQSKFTFEMATPKFTHVPRFQIEGSYFAQDQGLTTCCSHVAIMTALKNLFGENIPHELDSYPKINKKLGIDHVTRRAGNGIEMAEIENLLRLAKLRPVTYEAGKTGKFSADDCIISAYHCIENGMPSILCFASPGIFHAMTVVGHTFNPWQWKARSANFGQINGRGGYFPSHTWVDQLIVQDNSVGPYGTLYRADLIGRPFFVITFLPACTTSDTEETDVVNFPAIAAEVTAAHILTTTGIYHKEGNNIWYAGLMATLLNNLTSKGGVPYWFRKLSEHVAERAFVMRTTMIPKSSLATDLLLKELPKPYWSVNAGDELWLIEISIPELYQHDIKRLGYFVFMLDTRLGKFVPYALRVPAKLIVFDPTDEISILEVRDVTDEPEPILQVRATEKLNLFLGA